MTRPPEGTEAVELEAPATVYLPVEMPEDVRKRVAEWYASEAKVLAHAISRVASVEHARRVEHVRRSMAKR